MKPISWRLALSIEERRIGRPGLREERMVVAGPRGPANVR
jgi:hypothetical protein